MIDRLNLAVLAVALSSCGLVSGGSDPELHPRDSDWDYRHSCNTPAYPEGPLWRAAEQYHVTSAPTELAHLHEASVRYPYDGSERMVIEYRVDGVAHTVIYHVKNAP